MTARILANRLLESDEVYVSGEIERLTTSHYPDFELEMEGNHWNVYKKNIHFRPGLPPLSFVGQIYYSDASEAPPGWNGLPWMAFAGYSEADMKPCRSFKEAQDFIHKMAAKMESVDPDDPEQHIDHFISDQTAPAETKFTSANGCDWLVQIVWDETPGGRSYDAKGKEIPQKTAPLVKFYDVSGENHQFVSSYFADSFINWKPHTGLDLMGYEPKWKIDWRTMSGLVPWIKHEVESRGYRPVNDELNGINIGYRYEARDPDDPEIYLKYLSPEDDRQPSEEKLEGEIRRMLARHYSRVRINKRPGVFTRLHDNIIWTIHCERDTLLPLALVNNSLSGADWRKQVERWFKAWAAEAGIALFRFKIYGTLRRNPTFQFETVRWKFSTTPLTENDRPDGPDENESWTDDFLRDLYAFHSRGIKYAAINSRHAVYVAATTYFDPSENNFASRFQDFVGNWLKKHQSLPVEHLYSDIQRDTFNRWTVLVSTQPLKDTSIVQ